MIKSVTTAIRILLMIYLAIVFSLRERMQPASWLAAIMAGCRYSLSG